MSDRFDKEALDILSGFIVGQTAWEDGEKVLTFGGELIGSTIHNAEPDRWWPSLRERIAALYAARLRADAEEVARLRAEVREWICGKCRAVYPGPPQPGCSCVVCPACGGDTMPRASYEIARLRAMVDEGREHLLWCGGSADFAPGGLARLGWERGPMVWLNSLAALDAKGGA